MTQAKECKKCGALNAKASQFCEGCGKKFGKAQSGSGLLVFLVVVIIGIGVFGYSKGYRLDDLKKAFAPAAAPQTVTPQYPAAR